MVNLLVGRKEDIKDAINVISIDEHGDFKLIYQQL
jgi:hypothetical protein